MCMSELFQLVPSVFSIQQCDDGNGVDDDGCTNCVTDFCGDGVVNNNGAEVCRHHVSYVQRAQQVQDPAILPASGFFLPETAQLQRMLSVVQQPSP